MRGRAAQVIEGFNTSSDYHDLQKAATKARERGAAAEVAALEAKQRAMEEEGKQVFPEAGPSVHARPGAAADGGRRARGGGQGFGVQEIERRMLFMRLPPILFVNLQRLAYCPVRGVPMKINSRFAFAETLDLSARLARDAPEDPSGPPTYFLHSVIAHSGHSQVQAPAPPHCFKVIKLRHHRSACNYGLAPHARVPAAWRPARPSAPLALSERAGGPLRRLRTPGGRAVGLVPPLPPCPCAAPLRANSGEAQVQVRRRPRLARVQAGGRRVQLRRGSGARFGLAVLDAARALRLHARVRQAGLRLNRARARRHPVPGTRSTRGARRAPQPSRRQSAAQWQAPGLPGLLFFVRRVVRAHALPRAARRR